MKLQLLLLILIGFVIGAQGQQVTLRKVNGVVTDAGNRPLKNVSVTIFQAHVGTTTDKKGKFSLSFPKIGRSS